MGMKRDKHIILCIFRLYRDSEGHGQTQKSLWTCQAYLELIDGILLNAFFRAKVDLMQWSRSNKVYMC